MIEVTRKRDFLVFTDWAIFSIRLYKKKYPSDVFYFDKHSWKQKLFLLREVQLQLTQKCVTGQHGEKRLQSAQS